MDENLILCCHESWWWTNINLIFTAALSIYLQLRLFENLHNKNIIGYLDTSLKWISGHLKLDFQFCSDEEFYDILVYFIVNSTSGSTRFIQINKLFDFLQCCAYSTRKTNHEQDSNPKSQVSRNCNMKANQQWLHVCLRINVTEYIDNRIWSAHQMGYL